MLYKELVVNGETYKLRLDMQNYIALEKKLGTNPINAFMNMNNGQIPSLEVMTLIIFYSMQKYNHGTKLTDVYNLIDSAMEDEENPMDLEGIMKLCMDVIQESGFIKMK